MLRETPGNPRITLQSPAKLRETQKRETTRNPAKPRETLQNPAKLRETQKRETLRNPASPLSQFLSRIITVLPITSVSRPNILIVETLNRVNERSKAVGKRPSLYKNSLVIAIGKAAQMLARLKGGGGTAFPGLVVEKIAPSFAPTVLGAMPYGVVVVSGTNGKTTTTKIATELFEMMGLRVLSNDTGSNFMRGVIAAILPRITLGGRLEADIAVLELDEAHAVHFVKKVSPRYALLLNVMPDQLDRFGSVEYTAELLVQVARHTTGTVVANREDELLAGLGAVTPPLQVELHWFGLSPQLADSFSLSSKQKRERLQGEERTEQLSASVVLSAVKGKMASFEIEGATYSTELALKGIYNAYNAAAALALVREVLREGSERFNLQPDQHPALQPDLQPPPRPDHQPTHHPNQSPPRHPDCQPVRRSDQQLIEALAKVQGAFGRGESFVIGGREVEMVLVKNSGGFQLALESFDPQGHDTMIVINDEAGDGRDISWLFDVNFASLQKTGITMVSGTRAYDMALRLHYDEVPFRQVELDLITALDYLLSDATSRDKPLRIYCCYTAMTKLHARLNALAKTGGR